MKLSNFLASEIVIDMGTANTLIVHNNQVVVDEPSVIAKCRKSGKLIAVGKKAQLMDGRTHKDIKTIRPLRNGAIADFRAAEDMLRGLIKLFNPRRSLASSSHVMVISIPSGITQVERRAVRESAKKAGARNVYLIADSMAAAIGIGVDVKQPTGNMIIDIGGGTTDIAVIALGGIVCSNAIRVAGDQFNTDIANYMRSHHKVRVGDPSAESIKLRVGSALDELDKPPPDYAVHGRDLITGMPREIVVTCAEIARVLDDSIRKIEDAILKTLEAIPPELCTDICQSGIYLAGGGAMLRGLQRRLSHCTHLPVYIADDPLRAVVRGTGVVSNTLDNFRFLFRE